MSSSMAVLGPVADTEVESLREACESVRDRLNKALKNIRLSRIPTETKTFFRRTNALSGIDGMFCAEIGMLDRIRDRIDQPRGTLERDTFEDYRHVVDNADEPAQLAKVASPQHTRMPAGRKMELKRFLRKLFRTHWAVVDAIRDARSSVQHELKDCANDIEDALHDIQWLFDIFVCYAHEDGRVVNGVLNRLKQPLEQCRIGYWWDRKDLIIGDLWDEEIKKRLELVDVGLVFISDAFFASRYITEVEIKNMLERRAREGMVVCPVLLIKPKWRNWKKKYTWLHDTHALPTEGGLKDTPRKQKIVCQRLGSELDKVMTRLCTT